MKASMERVSTWCTHKNNVATLTECARRGDATDGWVQRVLRGYCEARQKEKKGRRSWGGCVGVGGEKRARGASSKIGHSQGTAQRAAETARSALCTMGAVATAGVWQGQRPAQWWCRPRGRRERRACPQGGRPACPRTCHPAGSQAPIDGWSPCAKPPQMPWLLETNRRGKVPEKASVKN